MVHAAGVVVGYGAVMGTSEAYPRASWLMLHHMPFAAAPLLAAQ